MQYVGHWRTIERVHGYGADVLLMAFQNYAANLARQQNSTYTLPFEVVTPNMGKKSIIFDQIRRNWVGGHFYLNFFSENYRQFSEWTF
jgi:hypothetical protein